MLGPISFHCNFPIDWTTKKENIKVSRSNFEILSLQAVVKQTIITD